MDIRNWPLDQIMQLPDWCFGQRVIQTVSYRAAAAGSFYDLCAEGLPEQCVIWSSCAVLAGSLTSYGDMSLVLGDTVPATDAIFFEHEALFRGVGAPVIGRPMMRLYGCSGPWLMKCRRVLDAKGRRLLLRLYSGAAVDIEGTWSVEVSGVPKEVPDWLVSA